LKIKDRIFAHRAGCGCFLGNTIEGIRYYIDSGLNFEIDVRACQNGLAITHHEKLGQDHIGQYSIEAVRKFGINRKDGSIVFAPATVHGRSDVARIPTLPEVLNLVAESGKEIKVILDIKLDPNIKDNLGTVIGEKILGKMIIESVIKPIESYNLQEQAIIGAKNEGVFLEIKKHNPEISTLLFEGSQTAIASLPISREQMAKHLPEATALLDKATNFIRLWQNWLENEYNEITDPNNLIEKLHNIGKKVIVTAGGMNEIQGGEISKGQFGKLMELGVDAVIVNDPAIYL
jgi:glycerophosphoryl diester phosphodiesterase